MDGLPKLAFDHKQIVDVAIKRLQAKIRYQPIGFELLPNRFSLGQLQVLYEKILQRKLDKRNFRKKLLSLDLLIDCQKKQENVPHRAAKLFRFNKKKYSRMEKAGFNFEL